MLEELFVRIGVCQASFRWHAGQSRPGLAQRCRARRRVPFGGKLQRIALEAYATCPFVVQLRDGLVPAELVAECIGIHVMRRSSQAT